MEDSFTLLMILDWYATLSVMFGLFVFFFRHTKTVIMMTAVVMSVPATPTPTNSDILLTVAPLLYCVGDVEASIVVV